MEVLSASFIYGVVKDGVKLAVQRLRAPTAQEVIGHRQRVKDELQQMLSVAVGAPAPEAVVRDMRRIDHYPNRDNGSRKRMSPWFRTEIKGLYFRGLECFLSIEALAHDDLADRWRMATPSDVITANAYLVGQIPFGFIKQVDPVGDECYPMPHIYCDYASRGQPWENLKWYWRHEHGDRVLFVEVTDLTLPKTSSWHSRYLRRPEA